jgi:hypothetical protein
MVIKSAFGGGPIAVDFMWSSGTGSEDGFASPPSPMFALFLLLLVAVFHNARRLKSVGFDPILLFQKWNQKHKHFSIRPHIAKTQNKSRSRYSLSFALKLCEERHYHFIRPPAKFRRL